MAGVGVAPTITRKWRNPLTNQCPSPTGRSRQAKKMPNIAGKVRGAAPAATSVTSAILLRESQAVEMVGQSFSSGDDDIMSTTLNLLPPSVRGPPAPTAVLPAAEPSESLSLLDSQSLGLSLCSQPSPSRAQSRLMSVIHEHEGMLRAPTIAVAEHKLRQEGCGLDHVSQNWNNSLPSFQPPAGSWTQTLQACCLFLCGHTICLLPSATLS